MFSGEITFYLKRIGTEKKCGLVIFTDMNTYILKKSKSFKIFLKENYAIALKCCYLLTKKL